MTDPSSTLRWSRTARLRLRRSVVNTRWMVLAGAAGCQSLRSPDMPWEHPNIVQAAPRSPNVPLAAPAQTLKCASGPAAASYPPQFSATIRKDGGLLFPEATAGKLKGASVLVEGAPVITIDDAGEVSGNALKHRYKFNAEGDLLDPEGHGVRVAPSGGVRGIGGKWRYQDVIVCEVEGGGAWDKTGWRTVALVSILLIENMLPDAIRESSEKEKATGKWLK